MDPETAQRLLALNEQFYQTFGHAFSSTRARVQTGVLRILDGLNGSENILDLGCGNGGAAKALALRNHHGAYVGLDLSTPLLSDASRGNLPQALFLQADLAAPGWAERVIANSMPAFDLVWAFAVLHHIPGSQARLAILQAAHGLLGERGRFIHSEWQFLSSERLRKRIQPWEAAGLSPNQVDPGDALLDWRAGGNGLRYVHHFDMAELESLAHASGFTIRETFTSDGENSRLSLYQIWERV